MKYGNYGVSVTPGISKYGYVFMEKDSFFTLELTNESKHDAHASVLINGKLVGDFFVRAYSKVPLETIPGSSKRFKFTGLAATLDRIDIGLISVTFTPGKKPPESYPRYTDLDAITNMRKEGFDIAEMKEMLDGKSDQDFTAVGFIPDTSKTKITIHQRLVSADLIDSNLQKTGKIDGDGFIGTGIPPIINS